MASATSVEHERVAGILPQPLADAVTRACNAISHNLNGQKMGRKGRITRERILAATIDLLDDPDEEPITLSAVARRASLGMTSLYNYFTDLTELLLAVLEPVMATAEDTYLAQLRGYWRDEELGARCLDFVIAYHQFWTRHSRLLHLRNSLADQFDRRMMAQRIGASQPVIELIAKQMEGSAGYVRPQTSIMAAMMMITIERSATLATDYSLAKLVGMAVSEHEVRFMRPGARLMELAIRDMRANGAD